MTVSVSLCLWLDKTVRAWTGLGPNLYAGFIFIIMQVLFNTRSNQEFLFNVEFIVIAVNHYEGLEWQEEEKIKSALVVSSVMLNASLERLVRASLCYWVYTHCWHYWCLTRFSPIHKPVNLSFLSRSSVSNRRHGEGKTPLESTVLS